MGKRRAIVLSAVLAGLLLLFGFTSDSKAELSIDELKNLLQESLTISEIDRELERLSAEEIDVGDEIIKTESDIEKQKTRVAAARQHAGKVLRSYYTGERNHLWMLLLHVDSLSDALSVFHYLQMIAENDTRTMKRHTASFQELERLEEQLLRRQAELGELKRTFLDQRDRVIRLQKELDTKLEQLAEKETLLAEMEKLNEAWREKGLPLFQTFLNAMSDAMLHLDGYLAANDHALETLSRKSFLFHIEEQPLNQFLREQNDVFERFEYSITKQHIVINGNQDDTRIAVIGHYEIELEPEQALRFKLDELTYNGFLLPDTTRDDMQQQFSMTFYPERNELTSLLQIDSIELMPGEFTIGLSLP